MTENNPDQTPADLPGPADEKPNQGPQAAATPEERIAALETEKQELRDRMLRIAAEFENYKKRARKEQTDAEMKGKENVLKDVLEVADNLDRAMAAAGENADVKGVVQGVQLVLRLFQQKLERHDVRPVDAKGQAFDPRVHEAISQVPNAQVAPGTVISELQRGYRIGERLLRPALVVVAVAPPSGEGGANGAGSGDGGSGPGNGTE